MADPSEVGNYGTIRLLKRREPNSVVAVYPIDNEQVSFGRDANCSIRLYYSEVSPLHCQIVFEERKAFLQVLGASGAVVDGCPVYPTKSAVPGGPATTVTVPLPNGSIFEIHKKRFMFNYPPKALRPQLFTPATVRRKTIRMSLVQSAQVFSPGPSPYPQENLRVLQSPLKLASSDSPVKLVDSNHPRVYEEEQDLVILEDVEPRPNGYHTGNVMSPAPARLQTLPPIQQGPPKTPRRRSAPSLHRAVLIRSAQRSAYMRDTQAQIEQHGEQGYEPQSEEILLDDEDAEGEDDDEIEEDEVMNSIFNPDETEDDATNEDKPTDMPVETEQNGLESGQIDEQDVTEAHGLQLTTPLQISRALHLGSFATPQPGLFANHSDEEHKERRKTGPQRPPPGLRFSLAPALTGKSMSIKEEEPDERETDRTLRSPSKRKEITDEERKAILERRRSALKAPDPEIGKNIFDNGEMQLSTTSQPTLAPTSPFKTLSTHIEEGEDTQVILKRMQMQVAERRASLSPTRPRISRGAGRGIPPPSPEKGFSLLAPRPRLGSSIRPFPKLEAGIMEETSDQLGKHDSMDVDDTVSTDKDQSLGTKENNEAEHTRTPRFAGLREMFRAPKVAMGLTTPAVRGVRDLFRVPAIPETPRMDGMQNLFAEKSARETPAFDGIKDMMQVDEEQQAGGKERICSSDSRQDDLNEATVVDSHIAGPTRKLPLMTRTLTRTKGARPRLIRTAGGLTDASTIADDEASFASNPFDDSKQVHLADGMPKAATMPRLGRGRRTTRTVSGNEESDSIFTAEKDSASGNTTSSIKDKESEKQPDREGVTSPVKSTPRSRGRRKAGASAIASDSEAGELGVLSSRRGVRTGSAPPETSVTRRSTRARSRSAEPDSDDNIESTTKTGTHVTATTVETIPEEEEPVSTQTKPSRKASAPVTNKTRRTRTRTESSADDAPPRKRVGRATASSNARRIGKSSAVEPSEDAAAAEDKENTPERSPTSEAGEGASSGPVKPPSKARAGAKPPSKTKAGLGSTRAKPASKTKVKTEDESSPAPRTTRTRARK